MLEPYQLLVVKQISSCYSSELEPIHIQQLEFSVWQLFNLGNSFQIDNYLRNLMAAHSFQLLNSSTATEIHDYPRSCLFPFLVDSFLITYRALDDLKSWFYDHHFHLCWKEYLVLLRPNCVDHHISDYFLFFQSNFIKKY